MNRKTIWREEQNKPTLVVKDIKAKYPDIDEDFIYEVLLRRGVFKWLSVRRQLIKLKNIWKSQLTSLEIEQRQRKDPRRKGLIVGLRMARKDIRALCHSERWQCPDFDKKAQSWLINRGEY